MRNFSDTFDTCKRLFVSGFSICMTVPLSLVRKPSLPQTINYIFLYLNQSNSNFTRINTD